MKRNESGMTLVELLATLALVSLVTGLIWTTVQIAVKFNIGETSSLRIQQEANYIIAELQVVHRTCAKYKLTITPNEVSVNSCEAVQNSGGKIIPDQIISNEYNYSALVEGYNRTAEDGEKYLFPVLDHEITSLSKDLVMSEFIVRAKNNPKRFVDIPTTISRYKNK